MGINYLHVFVGDTQIAAVPGENYQIDFYTRMYESMYGESVGCRRHNGDYEIYFNGAKVERATQEHLRPTEVKGIYQVDIVSVNTNEITYVETVMVNEVSSVIKRFAENRSIVNIINYGKRYLVLIKG